MNDFHSDRSRLAERVQGTVTPEQHGARGDAHRSQSGSATSGDATLTISENLFTSDDVGKNIIVQGAGSSGSTLVTTIASVTNASEVELSTSASVTASNLEVIWGTDDGPALQSALDEISSGRAGALIIGAQTNYLTMQELTLSGQDSVHIIGHGRQTSNIYAGGFNGQHFAFTDCNGVVIKHLSLKGEGINSANSVGGLFFDLNNLGDTDHHVIEGVKIRGVSNDGIAMNTAILTTLIDVHAEHVVGHGFNFYGGGTSTSLIDCYAVTCTKAGFRFKSQSYSSIQGCAAEASGIGYEIEDGQSISLQSCGSEALVDRGGSYDGAAFVADNLTTTLYDCYSRDHKSTDLRTRNGGTNHFFDFTNKDTSTLKTELPESVTGRKYFKVDLNYDLAANGSIQASEGHFIEISDANSDDVILLPNPSKEGVFVEVDKNSSAAVDVKDHNSNIIDDALENEYKMYVWDGSQWGIIPQ